MPPYGNLDLNIGSDNGLLPDSTRALPELMLTYHRRCSGAFYLHESSFIRIDEDINPWNKVWKLPYTLLWRHNGCDSISNQQPHDCLFNPITRRRSKKTSNLRVSCLCAGNSPGTGEFPAQMASNAENVSIWWRHHENTLPGPMS